MENVDVIISNPGDPAVGIPAETYTVSGMWLDPSDPDDAERREFIVETLTEAFTKLCDFQVQVYFSDDPGEVW